MTFFHWMIWFPFMCNILPCLFLSQNHFLYQIPESNMFSSSFPLQTHFILHPISFCILCVRKVFEQDVLMFSWKLKLYTEKIRPLDFRVLKFRNVLNEHGLIAMNLRCLDFSLASLFFFLRLMLYFLSVWVMDMCSQVSEACPVHKQNWKVLECVWTCVQHVCGGVKKRVGVLSNNKAL